MGVWDEALTLLTHIEDYDIDVEAVLANMHTYPITNEEVMGVVRLPGILAQLVPHVPHVDGLYVVGKDVKAALGLRVEMHPSFTSAELSHGIGIVTEVKCYSCLCCSKKLSCLTDKIMFNAVFVCKVEGERADGFTGRRCSDWCK